MKIESLGEFGLIQRLAKRLKLGPGVVKGVGDDCAVVEGPPMWYHLLTCDMLVDSVHFWWERAKPEQVGWKGLACSVSDIAAMGGIPQYAVVSLGLPKGCAVERLEKLYQGMQRMADTCGVAVVGGDTVRAPRLTMDVTLFGRVERTRLVLRSSAREGDHLFVTGALGGAVASGRHLTFTPRWQEARALGERFPLHAMMDLSDGLAGDLRHLAAASRVGAVVETAAIPCAKGATVKAALTDGEDFELLFTVPASVSPALIEWAAGALRCGVTKIGEIVPARQGVALQSPTGRRVPLLPHAFRHF